MDFTMIGTVNSYIRQKNLHFAANYKIRTGQRVVDANGNLQFAKSNMFDEMLGTQKKNNDELTSARIASIKQKLMNGRKLTTEEMGYLREKDPSLYKKAKHAEDSREELKNNLKKAKTKNEARQAVTQAMIKASAEASAELAAYKNGIMTGGGNISVASGNISGAENLSADTPSLIQANENISATGELAKFEIQANQETAENLQQANSENAQKNNTAEGILEKFIMTVRALEDEWANFTKSKEFERLPEDYFEEKNSKTVKTPNKKILDTILIYRNMTMQTKH